MKNDVQKGPFCVVDVQLVESKDLPVHFGSKQPIVPLFNHSFSHELGSE